jgi:hypothetical protein
VVCRRKLMVFSVFLLLARANFQGQELLVPAGTTLQCTLEDENLSSKTATLNDPILCDTGNLREFGVSVFPRGAYLEGRFADARDPGRLWGKGWMQLEFDHILLPGAELPISARVTSVPRLKVDLEGKIHGAGHARRDAVEWAVPVLWPEKVLTLPGRGPRPALKQETLITLKLMQSISIPQGAAGYQTEAAPVSLGAFRPTPASQLSSLSRGGSNISPQTGDIRLEQNPLLHQASLLSTSTPDRASSEGTLLVLKDGSAQLAKGYWFDSGRTLQYVSAGGKSGVLPIEALDLGATVKLNRERGVAFVIGSKDERSSGF